MTQAFTPLTRLREREPNDYAMHRTSRHAANDVRVSSLK